MTPCRSPRAGTDLPVKDSYRLMPSVAGVRGAGARDQQVCRDRFSPQTGMTVGLAQNLNCPWELGGGTASMTFAGGPGPMAPPLARPFPQFS